MIILFENQKEEHTSYSLPSKSYLMTKRTKDELPPPLFRQLNFFYFI